MQRICVDMDEVIADALTEHLDRYNRDHDGRISKSDLIGKHLWEVVPADRHGVLDEYVLAEDFFEDLAVMPDSQRVLEALQERYEVFIASAAMEVPTSFAAKFRWLQRHFPFIPPSHIVFCGDKAILNADFLIDDRARHFTRFKGEGILYSSPHNALVTSCRRVDSWLDVEKMFLG